MGGDSQRERRGARRHVHPPRVLGRPCQQRHPRGGSDTPADERYGTGGKREREREREGGREGERTVLKYNVLPVNVHRSDAVMRACCSVCSCTCMYKHHLSLHYSTNVFYFFIFFTKYPLFFNKPLLFLNSIKRYSFFMKLSHAKTSSY